MSLALFLAFILCYNNLSTGFPHTILESEKALDSIRIVGGISAPDNFAPHMVALVSEDSFPSLLCGGSIISEDLVLTAAHCIDGALLEDLTLKPTLRGVIGSNKHTSTENLISFKKYVNHPEHDKLTLKNDIGVLFTKQKIVFSNKVTAIRLRFSHVGSGEECLVAGWGDDGSSNWPIVVDPPQMRSPRMNIQEHLHYLYVQTISGRECMERVANQSNGASYVDPKVEICTLHSPGFGVCFGDSGSALVLKSTGEQIGVVAWGFPCARGAPDMFVRISGVADFLRRFLNKTDNFVD